MAGPLLRGLPKALCQLPCDWHVRLPDRGRRLGVEWSTFCRMWTYMAGRGHLGCGQEAREATTAWLDSIIYNVDGCELSESYEGGWDLGNAGQMMGVGCCWVCPLVHVVRLFWGMSQTDRYISSISCDTSLDSHNGWYFTRS